MKYFFRVHSCPTGVVKTLYCGAASSVILGIAAFVATCANSGAAEKPATLKESYANYFHVGVAINRTIATSTDVRADNVNRTMDRVQKDIALTKEQINQISPENDLKWALIQPREGADGYDFAPADAYVNFGLANHMYIVCLLYTFVVADVMLCVVFGV